METQKLCRHFRNNGSCPYGKKCKFRHDKIAEIMPKSRGHNFRQEGSKPKHVEKDEPGYDLRQWQRGLRGLGRFEPADTLEFIFGTAKTYLDTGNPEIVHSVIRSLAGEDGLQAVKAVAEDFPVGVVSVQAGRGDAHETILQFLLVVTHPNATSSLVLEQPLGTIYNILYGNGGSRGVQFFDKLVSHLRKSKALKSSRSDYEEVFAASVDCFSRLIELNQAAYVSEEIKRLAHAFEDCGEDLIRNPEPSTSAALLASRRMQQIQLRLGFADQVPNAQSSVAALTSRLAAFTIYQQLPGNLSCTGPRHDNDFANIRDIKILPTAEEIWSDQSEYLPERDPSTHHLQGVQGLLDRNFRLLREDTVGQLRDAIKSLGERSAGKQKQGIRSSVFNNAIIRRSIFDERGGLLHLVEFDQPAALRGCNASQRKQFWQESKHLALDSCVCLIDRNNRVTFLTVAERIPSPAGADNPPRTRKLAKLSEEKSLISLDENGERATIVVRLITVDNAGVAEVFARQSSRDRQGAVQTLVEFPGLLLASFTYTLKALQEMSRTGDLPFADILAPLADRIEAPNLTQPQAPRYASRAGFSFDLHGLVKDSDLRLFPGGNFDFQQFAQASGLDEAQAIAFHHALTNRFALLQGPPGTGKSYVGVRLIQTLLRNRKSADLGPILCVCYTNHALDQVLEHLVERDVKQIIRIGGQSKSHALSEVNLSKVVRGRARTKAEKTAMWHAHSDINSASQSVEEQLQKFDNASTVPSLRQHLQDHHTFHSSLLSEKNVDQEGFELVEADRSKKLRQWLKGGSHDKSLAVRSVKALENVDLFQMSNRERRLLFDSWVREIRGDALFKIQDRCQEFASAKRELETCTSEAALRCLLEAQVIGVTTTGLAKNAVILRKLRSKILVVEEAGEVMEAHMLPALLPSLEHVIAIGDHQQLRPQIANYDLSAANPKGLRYSLDISLFERLIHPGRGLPALPVRTLQTQRRMHPRISQLICRTIYPELRDTPSVSEYPDICGFSDRLFWMDHSHLEDSSDQTSKSNKFEVEMTVALTSHIIKQGSYTTSQITILTPYLGQLRLLRRRFANVYQIEVGEKDQQQLVAADMDDEKNLTPARRTALGRSLRISTVDNYQGEENEVIIVSLVRSNEDGNVGFLRTSNRINVLLSRARHAMYIIGNASTARNVSMWNEVIEILSSTNSVGPAFPLHCPRHPETAIRASDPDDFLRFAPEGGCHLTCNKRLKCGHSCVNKCHAQYLHDAVVCQSPCPRLRETCEHPCPKICGVDCGPKCVANVFNVPLPCGHIAASLACFESQDVASVKCQREVEKKVENCGHVVQEACYVSVTDDYRCLSACGALLPCGHLCARPCHTCNSFDELGQKHARHGECTRICDRNYSNCSHRCASRCHEGTPCPPCKQPCQVECCHSKCDKLCSEPCAPCAEQCAWACEHQGGCRLPCAVPCVRLPCSERCPKQLSCGHQCPSVCGEVCPPPKFCQTCAKPEVLNMDADFIMFSTYQEVDLSTDPVIIPPCGHLKTMSTFDGIMAISDFYETSGDGELTRIKGDSTPFEMSAIKTCPDCRGPLRAINRYSRIVKRGLIDEAAKRFILWSRTKLLKLGDDIDLAQRNLSETIEKAAFGSKLGTLHDTPDAISSQAVKLDGDTDKMITAACQLSETKSRYKIPLYNRRALSRYCREVGKREQPFQRVWDLCRKGAAGKAQAANLADFQSAADSVLNVEGYLMARSLLVSLDMTILTDLVEVWARSRLLLPTLRPLCIDTSRARTACLDLFVAASERDELRLQVEALVGFALFAAAEIRCPRDSGLVVALRALANARLDQAEEIMRAKESAQTLGAQVGRARKALRGTFESVVTDEEMRAVYAAMAAQFSGTGHWYRCENGHPFTIGECGMAMQRSTCPQCGVVIGGQNHQFEPGVARANDIEERFGTA